MISKIKDYFANGRGKPLPYKGETNSQSGNPKGISDNAKSSIKTELILWGTSVTLITACFLIFDRANYMSLVASIIGVTSLIFNAKGNPIGQALMVIFSLLYGWIAFGFAYYGEMLTYVGMTMPMSVAAMVSWIKNPNKGGKVGVKINNIKAREFVFMTILTVTVTIIFYHILAIFNTANLIPSTISVATSFAAVYLTFRRSPYYALAYASNDLVLIVMWILAAGKNIAYISTIVCFVVFFANDIYGYIKWRAETPPQA